MENSVIQEELKSKKRVRNASPDGIFAGPLADLSDIRTREAIGEFHQEVNINIRGDGTLAQDCLKDLPAAGLIWQWNVDELIQSARAEEG